MIQYLTRTLFDKSSLLYIFSLQKENNYIFPIEIIGKDFKYEQKFLQQKIIFSGKKYSLPKMKIAYPLFVYIKYIFGWNKSLTVTLKPSTNEKKWKIIYDKIFME